MSIKYLPISHFENQGTKATGPIWCINTATESNLAAQGEVLLAIPKRNGNGQPDLLRIPMTWLPQEITRTIPRLQLLSSTEFRTAVSNQLISLISEDTAHRLLSQSGAKEEQGRLVALAKHIRDAGSARTIADSNTVIARADGIKDDDDDSGGLNKTVIIDHSEEETNVAVLASQGVEDIEPGITPAFKMWVDKVNTGNDVAAKNEIKGRRSFSKAELGFLHRKLNRKFVATIAMIEKNLGVKKAA